MNTYTLIQVKKKFIVQGIFYEPSILHALLKKRPKVRKLIWEIVPKKGEGGPAQSQFSCSQIAEQEYSLL